jgi:ClpP class serine protease
MQSRVDDYYGAFVRAVAKGRGVPVDSVRNGMGQGRVLGGDQALEQKMVDGVETFDAVLKKVSRAMKQTSAAPAGRSSLDKAKRDLDILG